MPAVHATNSLGLSNRLCVRWQLLLPSEPIDLDWRVLPRGPNAKRDTMRPLHPYSLAAAALLPGRSNSHRRFKVMLRNRECNDNRRLLFAARRSEQPHLLSGTDSTRPRLRRRLYEDAGRLLLQQSVR